MLVTLASEARRRLPELDPKKLLFTIRSYAYLEPALPRRGRLRARRDRAQDVPRRRALPAPRRRPLGPRRGAARRHADRSRLARALRSRLRDLARRRPLALDRDARTSATRRWSAPCSPGEVVTAKTRARLISAIPPCEGGTRVFLFDLHTDGIEFYFGDSPRHAPPLRRADHHRGDPPRSWAIAPSCSARPTPAARSGCRASRATSGRAGLRLQAARRGDGALARHRHQRRRAAAARW